MKPSGLLVKIMDESENVCDACKYSTCLQSFIHISKGGNFIYNFENMKLRAGHSQLKLLSQLG